MLNLSAALGRLVLSGRELARLSGFSSRVTGLIDVIDDVNRGMFRRGQKVTIPGNSSTVPGAAGVQVIATRASPGGNAVVSAGDDAEMEARATITPLPRRNAGVAGVNLATEPSPSWVAAAAAPARTSSEILGLPTAPSGNTEASPASLSLSPPSSNHVNETPDLPSNRQASEDDDDGPSRIAARTTAAAAGVALGRPAIGTLPSEIRWQAELAPEGTAGRAAEAVAGAGAAGEDGERLVGSGRGGTEVGDGVGAPLQRSGSVLLNEDCVIEFTDVPLVTPTGEVLIDALSFKVRHEKCCTAVCSSAEQEGKS